MAGLNPKDLVGAKKAPLGLVPPALEIGAAEAMANGADKYGPYNWRLQPIQFMTYLEAMKRHILALIDGEDNAPDTGIHHLKHIAAGGGILLDALAIPGGLIDNRPPKGPAADLLRKQDRSVQSRIEAAQSGVIPVAEMLARLGIDGTEGGDVVPGDTPDYAPVGCDPTTCVEDPDCGVHDPVMGQA